MKRLMGMPRPQGLAGWFAGLILLAGPLPALAQGYTITTFAGGGNGGFDGMLGDGGPAVNALILNPNGMAIDSAGNLYIADWNFSVIRKVAPNGIISTIAGIIPQETGGSAGYSGDGGPATKAELNYPMGLAMDSSGNLYIADSLNFRIRKVAPSGIITTVAGTGAAASLNLGDGGPATQAPLEAPYALAVDGAGNVYFTESLDVRKISPSGVISTIAKSTFTSAAGLINPYGIAVDGAGNVYFSERLSNTIRRVTPAGVMTTVAGSGAGSFQGDGGPASAAGFYKPDGVAVDAAGNLFIADTGDNRVRMVNTSGTITTIAGTGELQTSGDGGPATNAALCMPSGIVIGSGGVVFVSDQSSDETPNSSADGRVRKLTPVGGTTSSAPSIKSGGIVSAGAFGQFTSIAPGSWIEIYGANLSSNTRSWAGADFSGVNAPTSLDGTKVTIGGQLAFVDYISPTQVNAQVPSTVVTGAQPVIVTTNSGASTALNITVNAVQPGLLAPASFISGGKQYAAALFADGSTFVLPPGTIAGLASRRAQPGDTITLYGIGFGPVTPTIPAGQIVQQSNSLASAFHVFFGPAEAAVSYAGLAPNSVGLYQINVVVPNIAASDVVLLTFTLGGVPSSQMLYLAVQ